MWGRNEEYQLCDRDLYRFTMDGPVLIREGVVRTYIRRFNYRNTYRTSELTASYAFNVNKFEASLLLGASQEYNKAENENFMKYDLTDDSLTSLDAAATNGPVGGNYTEWAMRSYFGNKSTMRLIAGNRIVPSVRLVDMYENADGSPFDWDDVFPGFNDGGPDVRRDYMCVAIDQGSTVVTSTLDCDTAKVADAYRNRDPRLCLNVITPYSHYLGTDAGSQPMDKQFVLADPSKGGAPMEAFAFIRNSEGWNSYFWRKWIPTGNLDGYWGEYTRTPYEFPLIRLGDVILMLAEAYNETGATDKAIAEVNKIRERAGMPGLCSGPEWLKVDGYEDMAARIRNERAYELAGEGQRYWDLRRWGLLEASVENACDIFGDLMYVRSWQPRHELWPIPLVEMERNRSLEQNPGW